MAQSLTQLYVHLIFHTKNKYSLIHQNDAGKLHAYMATIIKDNKSIPILINSVPDHVHILCILSRTIALSKLVQEVKQQSSRWLKTLNNHYTHFEWQGGYGGFSISPSLFEKTFNYIQNQEEHHRKRSFREEYILFLKEYKIEYNDKYIWE